ncbi:MAG: hypothetical protein IJ002_07165 [Clostridia bacterium]|nr:hypothetical protein [Clostridia bacterium]
MNKKYFPGANSGKGFFSRFDGIIPTYAEPHYTYVLKGGPGVGKNTLMKKVAQRAVEKGYAVEEFRCASDPKSFDAVRVPKLGIVLLDGTAPHSIDPAVPGINDEVIDLGHFKNHHEFATYREPINELLADNKSHYNAAYAMLGAARLLKNEAVRAAYGALDIEKLRAFIARLITSKKQGTQRKLFARSATPDGVMDFSSSFLPEGTVKFTGIVGEIALAEAEKMLAGKQCDIFYDFVDPDAPYAIAVGDTAISIGEGGDTLTGMYRTEAPAHIGFCLDKAEHLIKRAIAELSKALAAHDKIEEIYRDYVDYDRVNKESEALLKRIGL